MFDQGVLYVTRGCPSCSGQCCSVWALVIGPFSHEHILDCQIFNLFRAHILSFS